MKFTAAIRNINKNFYITTPIFYANSVPHIGHLYSALLADAQSRWKIVKGDYNEVVFATGTDEHGYKIQKKAKLERMECIDYCDKISVKYKELFDSCNIKYTDFIRTTERRHKEAVYQFWDTINKNGYIYKTSFSGWYSVNDECFLNVDEIEEKVDSTGKKIKVSIESGHQVEKITEDNYMFRLSEFTHKLKEYINKNVVIPKTYQNTLWTQIENLTDLSVSRESKRVHWGIPVPNDSSQVIYVWLDALVNYLTVAGYPDKKFTKLWPADVHVVGKDILKFHAIFWPAFLMAANIDPPKKIFCHGHWLVNNKKMSKSIGNVIDPVELIKKYTKDGLRFFLLREGVPESDCNINMDKFANYINAELANTLGNLYQRCLPFNKNMVFLSFKEIEPFLNEDDKKMLDNLNKIREQASQDYEEYNFYMGIQNIMSVLRSVNNMVQEYKPWVLVKSSNEKDANELNKLLFMVYESLRISCILLQPIVPDLANDLLDRLSIDKMDRCYKNALVDYNRAELKKIIQNSNVIFKRILK